MSFLNGATVGFDTVNNKAVFIDQTLLPNVYKEISTDDFGEMFEAIRLLKVRGAPAIGVFTAISLAVLMNKSNAHTYEELISELSRYADELIKCRPTAVNLKWAAEQMKKCGETSNKDNFKENLTALALKIISNDIEVCRKIGEYGAEILKNCNSFLTHCNAGRLAAVKYGTALAPLYVMKEQGKSIRAYADETRPLLQGARLTAYELYNAGIDVTLICDNMASYLMKQGKINAVFVGCDRVAANGDTANKIGTSGAAVLAKYYGIPFYVFCPSSTIDFACRTGEDINIEFRSPNEIKTMFFKEPSAPEGVKCCNPAFDVTGGELITAIVTERGICRPPYEKSLYKMFKK